MQNSNTEEKIGGILRFAEDSLVAKPSSAKSGCLDQKTTVSDMLRAFALTLPKRFQKLFRESCEKKVSPRIAIKAKCHDCCGYENVTERISDCSSWRCPLWAYRPYQTKRIGR